MSEDNTMVSPEANIKIKQSLENAYRDGVVDGIKMGKESCVKNNSSAVPQSSYLAVGMIVGYLLGTMI